MSGRLVVFDVYKILNFIPGLQSERKKCILVKKISRNLTFTTTYLIHLFRRNNILLEIEWCLQLWAYANLVESGSTIINR